jgi:phage tail protein X
MFYILLDAEVFQAENLNFGSRRCLHLLALSMEGKIKLYATDVTIGETYTAIGEAVHRAIVFLKNKENRRILGALAQSEEARISGAVEKLDEPKIVAEMKAKFDQLLKDLGTIIISTDDVPISEVRRRYFDVVPPFASRESKKSEFPDALSILAAEVYAKNNGITLHVVSADRGIAAAVEVAREQGKASHLEYAETLQAMIGKILRPVHLARLAEKFADEHAQLIKVKIREEFENSSFNLSEWGEVADVEVHDIDISESPTVVEVNGNVVTLNFGADVYATATATMEDFHLTYGSSGYLQREVEISEYIEADIEIVVTEPPEFSESKILSVSLEQSDFDVKFPWRDVE